ncbi:MAG: NupC/NupG family nucleoside CNT transporter, partial [Halieaceae bacterium]|nr:NupC/NupG family nucleoside CNT transporter [Halieaceae bacterium]
MSSLLGIGFLLLVAWLLSSNRRAINLRTVGLAFALQVFIGYVALFSDWGQAGLNIASEQIAVLLGFSRAGIDFMFGGLVSVDSNLGFIFAFSV